VILTTKTKVEIARILYGVILKFRRTVMGKGAQTLVNRRGIQWSLDLNEGIDLSIYLFGAFERSTVKLLEKLVKPGDVILDIGANIGAHTLYLAKSVGPGGKVIAFEPTDYAFQKLQRNLALNPLLESRVTAEQLMLVDDRNTPLEAEIYSSWPLDTRHGVHEKLCGKAMPTAHAHAERLDDYARRTGMKRADLIKLDVDGHEASVLFGARQMIGEFRPTILMELSPYIHDVVEHASCGGFAELIGLLDGFGYSMFNLDSGKSLPFDPVFLRELIPDGSSINVLLKHTHHNPPRPS
jgi:FkbM family methyltransferase